MFSYCSLLFRKYVDSLCHNLKIFTLDDSSEFPQCHSRDLQLFSKIPEIIFHFCVFISDDEIIFYLHVLFQMVENIFLHVSFQMME